MSRGFRIDNQLADDDDVAGLQTLGALLDIELDALAFLEVLETITLDGGKVDKDIIAAFAGNEAVALCSVEPLDCTVDTFRHFCLLMASKILEGTHGVA